MFSHNINSAKSLIVLAFLAIGFLIIVTGCSQPPPPLSITLAPPGPNIEVQPGEVYPIAAQVVGEETQVTWIVTCRNNTECSAQDVLESTEGTTNFFTAPNIPGEPVTVEAIAKDKYGQEANSILTFIIQEAVVAAAPANGDLGSCQSLRSSLGGSSVDVKVGITFPEQCMTGLPPTITAKGTYSGNLNGKEIWILVFPTDQKYYPQTVNACERIPSKTNDGTWQTIVNFGGPPQQYDVVAVVIDTNSEASQEFKEWLQNGCTSNDFPGYQEIELPDGITEVDAVTVSKG